MDKIIDGDVDFNKKEYDVFLDCVSRSIEFIIYALFDFNRSSDKQDKILCLNHLEEIRKFLYLSVGLSYNKKKYLLFEKYGGGVELPFPVLAMDWIEKLSHSYKEMYSDEVKDTYFMPRYIIEDIIKRDIICNIESILVSEK